MSLIHLYVDGSCGDNRNVTNETIAGWGVCIVSGDSGTGRGQGQVIEEMSGRVITDPDAAGYIGASVGSNNTAELPQYVTLDATSSTCLTIYFALCAFMYWSDSWKTRNLMTCVTSFFRKLSRPTAANKLTSRNKLSKNSEMRFVRCEIHGLFL